LLLLELQFFLRLFDKDLLQMRVVLGDELLADELLDTLVATLGKILCSIAEKMHA